MTICLTLFKVMMALEKVTYNLYFHLNVAPPLWFHDHNLHAWQPARIYYLLQYPAVV